MNAFDIYSAIGGIDEGFLEESETPLKRKISFIPIASVAACIAIIAAGVYISKEADSQPDIGVSVVTTDTAFYYPMTEINSESENLYPDTSGSIEIFPETETMISSGIVTDVSVVEETTVSETRVTAETTVSTTTSVTTVPTETTANMTLPTVIEEEPVDLKSMSELDRPYKDAGVGVAETAIIFPWDYLTISEQYSTMSFNGKKYAGRSKIKASFVGEVIGSGDASGWDEYTEEEYHRDFSVSRIKGIDDNLMIAVNMEGKYYIFKNDKYDPPKTFGELIDGYDLTHTLRFENFFAYEGYSEKSYYRLKNDDFIIQILSDCREAEWSDDYLWDRDESDYLSFSVISEPLGVYKQAFYVSKDGYIDTNIFDWGYSYYIGEEAAGQIIDYAMKNSSRAVLEPYMDSLAGTVSWIGDGYILVDDSILCVDPDDGMTFKIFMNDIRVRRCIEFQHIGVGDTVRIQFTGGVDVGNGNIVYGVDSIDIASISGGEVMVNE